MKILGTGGAGFIGSALVRNIISNVDHSVVNLDRRTYAAIWIPWRKWRVPIVTRLNRPISVIATL